jgi:hypothetical protein
MLAASRSLWRSKTNVGAKFKRLRVHLGAAKAITAMAHDLARLVYRMLKYGQQYVDEGMEFYQQRYQQQQINWMQKKAKDFGPTNGCALRFRTVHALISLSEYGPTDSDAYLCRRCGYTI